VRVHIAGWRATASLALQVVLLGLIAFALMLRTPQVSGPSMSPEIQSGEYVVVNTLSYRLADPKRGEIMAFRHERSAPMVFLKRVIALPGERIRIDRGHVLVDGRPLQEPYLRFGDERSVPETLVPPASYYVLGDNRRDSDDSRDWGPVSRDQIVGRALFALWPPSRFGAL
jgi:signal peptidase I